MPLCCNTELVEDELALLFDDGQSDSEEYSLDSFEIYESSSALSFLLRLRTLLGCFLAFATCGLPLATCGLRHRRLLVAKKFYCTIIYYTVYCTVYYCTVIYCSKGGPVPYIIVQ
jgi:hypothetical protein